MKTIYTIMGIIVSTALLSTLIVSNAFAVGGITITNISTSIKPVHVGNTFNIKAKISNNSNKPIFFGPCALDVKMNNNNVKVLPRGPCPTILIKLIPGQSHTLSTTSLKAIHAGPTVAHLTFNFKPNGHISKDFAFKVLP